MCETYLERATKWIDSNDAKKEDIQSSLEKFIAKRKKLTVGNSTEDFDNTIAYLNKELKKLDVNYKQPSFSETPIPTDDSFDCSSLVDPLIKPIRLSSEKRKAALAEIRMKLGITI